MGIKVAVVALACAILATFSTVSLALDNDFSGWDNKPAITSTIPDYLAATKWDTDGNNLYLLYQAKFAESPGKAVTTTSIDTEFGKMTLHITYNHTAEKADVSLVDARQKTVFSDTYLSDSNMKGVVHALVVAIPMKYLCSNPQVGYEFTVSSGSGSAKITTAGTTGFPWLMPLLLVPMLGIGWLRSRNKKRSKT